VVVAPFRYQRAGSFEEAVAALAEHGEDAKLLAGGQSLVPMLNLRVARPEWLIDINPVGAGPVAEAGSMLRLPALTRHRVLESDELVRRRCPLLAEAASLVGNVRTRARGTIGGSLAHADPAGELPLAALTLGAEVSVLGPEGVRGLSADQLLISYLTTALAPEEVITEVRVPALRPRQGWSFLELVRRTSDWMVVGASALIELDERGAVAAASLTFGGVAERPVAVPAELLTALHGEPPDEPRFAEAAERAAATLRPEDDVHASGAYRQRVAGVLGRRALNEAAHRARASGVVA